MSSKCYLVARDAQTNNFEMMKDFSSLREADLFTINYHSSEDLAKSIWKGNIVPKQSIDFFIVLPMKGKKIETTSVLYSNSKEIGMIDREDVDVKENTLKHFCEKTETALKFFNKVKNSNPELYAEIKNSFLEEDKEVSYKTIREAILSFTEYKDDNKESNNLHRLVLESELLTILSDDYNEKQISFLEPVNDIDSTDKIIEILEIFRNMDNKMLDIKDGVVYTTNNIYTYSGDLEKLDSLLDQRIGFVLHDYLTDHEEEKDKQRELKIVEILYSDKKTLNDTYRYAKSIDTGMKQILGDNNGYQYRK